ncbi:MAG: hypothetical protein DRH17_13215 [Deltaproteobacteria bacterium]|nr:MAG: hypothetical protein DRH17_13215 [Deltaproteobacteria bacterium]
MATRLHQMLVGLIGRKMREEGYNIVAFDGNEYLFDGQKLKVPVTIKKHRPDLIGFRFETKEVCIGEAKTERDLYSERTREQLLDYSNSIGISSGENIRIVLGIPKSAEEVLLNLLHKLNLFEKDFITYVWLPEELVGDD